MGIDARMFARLRGANRLRPDQVLPLAVELAKTVGAGHFMITKDQEWARAFGPGRHALSVIEPLSDETAREYDCPELAGKVVWFQDGDPIVADPDEQFVEVHLMTRYYGPEYARGNWPVIRTVAEWLEFKLPGAEVWYGGDSSGVCAVRFGPNERALVNRFYLGTGHRTYRSVFDGLSSRGKTPPICGCCEASMSDCGGGNGSTFWFCDGCNGKAVTHADGRFDLLDRYEEFFTYERDRAEKVARQAASGGADA
jgi:hypothetical protein